MSEPTWNFSSIFSPFLCSFVIRDILFPRASSLAVMGTRPPTPTPEAGLEGGKDEMWWRVGGAADALFDSKHPQTQQELVGAAWQGGHTRGAGDNLGNNTDLPPVWS